MWAANAATVSPSPDSADGRMHITPANLVSHLHRSLETPTTAAILRAILPGELSSTTTRSPPPANSPTKAPPIIAASAPTPAAPASKSSSTARPRQPRRPPHLPPAPNHHRLRIHRPPPSPLSRRRTFFVRQNPAAIDAGVFHNDVIAVAHLHVLLYHELAFADSPTLH